MNTKQNINRVLPAMTAEAYFKNKEAIEAWLKGADVQFYEDKEWHDVAEPSFREMWQYRIKPANIKKYIIVGFDGDKYHHTHGVWDTQYCECNVDLYADMRNYQQRTLIELEINPSNGEVVAAKVVE